MSTVIYSGFNCEQLNTLTNEVARKTSYTYSTSLPYTANNNGVALIQLLGSGSVANIDITLSGVSITAQINNGNALSSSAIYEFGIHMLKNDTINSIDNASLIRIIYVWS